MKQRVTRFLWTKRRLTAALEVAKDQLLDNQIAEKCGISRVTLERWKNLPEFMVQVEQHHETWRKKVRAEGIANRQNRVDFMNERWAKLRQVLEERGLDPSVQAVPGGKTGLLCQQANEVYAVDTGTLKELREHEKQAAQELGQWMERSESKTDVHLRGGAKEILLGRLLAGDAPDEGSSGAGETDGG